MLKTVYVGTVRGMARAADATRVRERMLRSNSPVVRHGATLLAVYDLPRMIELDRPWWVYRAADEVDEFLAARPGARAFEFGAGASTIWLADRVEELHSVEHDVEFAAQLSAHLGAFPNVNLHTVTPGTRTNTSEVVSERSGYETADFATYVSTVRDVGGRFDLIVIDGRARSACAPASGSLLAPDGMIVFDNSNRARYRDAIVGSGFTERRITGWCPSLPYRSTTSLLRRRAATMEPSSG